MLEAVLEQLKRIVKDNAYERDTHIYRPSVMQYKIKGFGWLDDDCNEYNWRDGVTQVLANQSAHLSRVTIENGYVDKSVLSHINGIVVVLEAIAE